MNKQIPLVRYLVLDGTPHLTANECTDCGARFFDRRNACAACSGVEFKTVDVATSGTVTTFSIVHQGFPGTKVPFAACVVDCDGTAVKGNIINTPIDPEHIHTGMRVRLATYVAGTDSQGTEAIGYGFEPVKEA